MADKAHKDTDNIIEQLDKKLGLVYSQANIEMQQKLDSYLQKSEAKDKIKLQDLKSGKITKKEYTQWKTGQVKIGQRWQEMKDTLANDMTNTNKIATDLINGHKPSVYALNHTYATFQVEKDSLTDTSYSLYSHEAVENLIKNEPNLLPKNKVDIPKDKAWNKKKIDNAITQGILQGESLKDVSGRLKNVTDMNQNAAMRNARTAMTSAQNVGRIDAYKRAKNLGINMKKVWLATLDGRTRHSHRMLDGQKVDIDKEFDNKCLFPGDPSGPASEVYNCRCTLLSQPTGVDYKVSDLTKRNDKLDGMGYEAWKNYHSFGLANGIMPDANITSVWSNTKMSNVYKLIHGQNVTDGNKFYSELGKIGKSSGVKPSEVWEKYLNGELDADDVIKFEDILKKYLPDSTVDKIEDIADAMSHDDFLKSIKNLNLYSDEVDFNTFSYILETAKTTPFTVDEYFDMYKQGKIEDSHLDELLGFKKVAKATDKIDDISDAAKEAEAALKIPKGNPMTKEQADNYKVNVFYDKSEATLTNCQTTTFAYECRCQGYDVVAIPKDKSLKEIFDLQDDLADDPSKAWINKTTGKPPKHELEWWNAGKDSPTNAEMIKAIDDAVGHNGERYAISLVNNSGKSAHLINIDRDENGLLRIVDNQRGPLEKNTWIGAEVGNYLDNFKTINYLIRQDDCVPNPEYFNKILTNAVKAKPDLPASASSFADYSKLNKFVKDNNLGKTSEYYKKWKYGIVDDDKLDDLLGFKKSADKVDDLVDIKKKLPTLDEMIDDDNLEKLYDDLFAEFKGKHPGITFKDYYDDYVKGNVVDSALDDVIKKYYNITNKTEDEKIISLVDLDKLKNKKVMDIYHELEAEGTHSKFYSELKNIGKADGIKQGEVWKKYINGELDPGDMAKVDSYLLKKYPKAVEPGATETITKSDDLIKAEEKLKKTQDELKKYQNKTYSGIWPDDVSLAEYTVKEDKIAAKKQFFKDKIKELENIKLKPGTFDYMYFGEKEGIEKEIAKLQKHMDDLNDFEIKGKEYAKLQKEVTKAQMEVQKYAPSPFSNSYSQERKDAALWPKSRQEADKLFSAHSQVEWDAAKPAERAAIKDYTQSYHKFNEPLRGIEYGTSKYKGVGKTDLNAGSANNGKALNAMTDYLDKCSSEHDQWLQRGCKWSGMDKFLQIDMNKLQYGTEKELQNDLLGKTITEYGFMSAGTAKGKGFSGNILFNIFTPKGTKMSYAELYSHYKGGSEVETILQQGSQFVITKVEKTNGQIYIDIELINQLPPQRWTP